MAGTRCSQTLSGLIHSLTAPGGLVALQDLSRPLSLHSCHFTRPPDRFSAHGGAPSCQFNAFFSSGDSFLSASKVSLCGSPRPPAHQMLGRFVCLCRQLDEASLSALQVSSPSVAFLQTKSKFTTVPNLFQLLRGAVSLLCARSLLALYSHYARLRLLCCSYWTGNYSQQ